MDLFTPEALRKVLLFAPPFIISLSFHEFAHAWVADKLGDSTARYLGRLTMDPMAHISLVGTVIFPAIALLTGAPLFGWANPVPIDMRNFKKPRAGMALVALAGPISNLLLATLCIGIFSIVVNRGNFSEPNLKFAGAALQMLVMAIQVNLFLAFFNLLPIPPLDGGHILKYFAGNRLAAKIDEHANMGQIIILVLFFTGFLQVLAIPVMLFMGVVGRLFGVPAELLGA